MGIQLEGVAATCVALDLPKATYYRRLKPRRPPEKRSCHRALGAEERQAVLELLHEPRFADLAPAEVYAGLLDEGRYLCSERTMYRVLAENAEVRERPSFATRTTRRPSSSPPRRTSSGAGTSPSSSARRSGPTTTCT